MILNYLTNPQAPCFTDRATRNSGLFLVDHMDDHKQDLHANKKLLNY